MLVLSGVPRKESWLIAWSGPRSHSTLLLPIFEGGRLA